MFRRSVVMLFIALGVFSCSSSGGRAPVSDITLATNNASGKKLSNNTNTTVKTKNLNQKNYTVQNNDTLYAISWKTGVDVNLLIQRNNLKKPYIIKKGQVLQLRVDKQLNKKNINNKSDLPSQNVNKTGNSACIAQNCKKNQKKVVDQEKTKVYSGKKTVDKIDKKIVPSKSKPIKSKKVGGWDWPVNGKLSKRFSASQSEKQGISLVNERGSAIRAAAAGKVVYAGNGLRGYGNLIIIKHNNDYLSAYAHNQALLVRENEPIKMGQKIALMGDSGSDHVHLHFEIRYRGKSVDPLRYLPKR